MKISPVIMPITAMINLLVFPTVSSVTELGFSSLVRKLSMKTDLGETGWRFLLSIFSKPTQVSACL